MKVLVYDVAAELGGPLTILKHYYDIAVNGDEDIEWKFMVSLPKMENTSNVTVENYPQVKNGWIARYMFDKFTAPKIIKEFNPDYILNLQNICVRSKCKQMLYMHQLVPFMEYRYPISDFKMWMYQNVIGRMIKKSCKKAEKIIVQTKWVKDVIVEQCRIDPKKVTVETPEIDKSKIKLNTIGDTNQFFYPASAMTYKNHQVVVDACEKLTVLEINYDVYFTLNGDESEPITAMKNKCVEKGLSVHWIGVLTLEEVYDKMAESVLVFPSYVETLGLPLLEARVAESYIIASNTPFAREVCDGYDKVEFFERYDAETLAKLMAAHKKA